MEEASTKGTTDHQGREAAANKNGGESKHTKREIIRKNKHKPKKNMNGITHTRTRVRARGRRKTPTGGQPGYRAFGPGCILGRVE